MPFAFSADTGSPAAQPQAPAQQQSSYPTFGNYGQPPGAMYQQALPQTGRTDQGGPIPTSAFQQYQGDSPYEQATQSEYLQGHATQDQLSHFSPWLTQGPGTYDHDYQTPAPPINYPGFPPSPTSAHGGGQDRPGQPKRPSPYGGSGLSNGQPQLGPDGHGWTYF